jgi:hypothetical protein
MLCIEIISSGFLNLNSGRTAIRAFALREPFGSHRLNVPHSSAGTVAKIRSGRLIV